MTSAGKWVLGLLLLVVGAVFVARTISSDPGSQAQVKQLSPAAVAGATKSAEAEKAAAAAAAKKAAAPAGDLACKKACVEVNEVSNDSITTAKLAPGSVTLSKLAFEVPNLNELENEINARKAAEASSKVALAGTEAALSEAAAAGAKTDASITAAAANGLSVESAARAAALDDLGKKTAAADAEVVSKLNKEVTDRGTADDVLQGKLNTEIADRAGALLNLRGELGNPNSVGAPIIKINNNEIVGDAITSDKVIANTLLAEDLATGAVTSDEVLNDTVAAVDLADASVVGRAEGETLTNTKARTLRGERTTNSLSSTSTAGDLALGTLTGEGDNVIRSLVAIGNIGLRTVGRNNLVDKAVDNAQLELNAVTSDRIALDTILANDISTGAVTSDEILEDTIAAIDLANGAVVGRASGESLTNTKAQSLRGQRDTNDVASAQSAGDLALGTITGENNNTVSGSAATGNLGLRTVGRNNLVDKAIDTAQLELNAITSDRIALDTIGADDIASGAVTTIEILDGSVKSADIGTEEVKTGNIKDQNVTNGKLADADGSGLNGAVSTAKINTGAVTAAKLADVDGLEANGAVTSSKISKGAVTATKLADVGGAGTGGAVTTTKIDSGAVTFEKLAADAVRGGKDGIPGKPNNVLDGSITDDDLDASAGVSGAKLKNGSVTSDKLSVDASATPADEAAVATDNIRAGAVTDIKLATGIAAAKISGDLSGATIGADKLTSGTLDVARLAANTVTADKLANASDKPVATNPYPAAAKGITNAKIEADAIEGGTRLAGATQNLNDVIKDDSLTADDIKASAVTSSELAPDAVDSSKIANGSVTASDLKANAERVDPLGGALTPVLAGSLRTASTSFGATGMPPVSLTITDTPTALHKVMVTAQAQFVCLCGNETATVKWQLFDGAVPLSAEYMAIVDASNPAIATPVAFLQTNAVPGAHDYRIKVTLEQPANAGSPAVPTTATGNVSSVVINAVDLGRAA